MNKAKTGRISTEIGHSLFYRFWKGEAERPVLLFVHGMGEHSGRYGHPIKYFSERGYTIYAYDQRGHGRSSGVRAYSERFARFLGDLDRVIKFIQKREGDKKLFLICHSFGAQVGLTYGTLYGNRIDGLIASSPNVRLAMPVPILKKSAGLLLSRILPKLTMDAGIDPKMISHDEEEVMAYEADPLVNRNITVRLASEMLNNQANMDKLARTFKLSCFLMHGGDDQISDHQATVEFYQTCASYDKELKVYPGLYHELFNEVDKLTIFKDMQDWLTKRC